MSTKLTSTQAAVLFKARDGGSGRALANPRTVQSLISAGLAERGQMTRFVYPTPAGLAALEQHEAQR